MKRILRIFSLFLGLICTAMVCSGCLGGPGVEPPFRSESGGAPVPGADDSPLVPTGFPQEGEEPPGGGEQGADDGDSVQPDPVPGSEGSAGGSAADIDGENYTPTGFVGDGGVPPQAGDAGTVPVDGGDGGGPGDAGWVQAELFFE